MGQLVDAQKEVTITSEASERELELEAQLVEARSIIQEQVLLLDFSNTMYLLETLQSFIIVYFLFYVGIYNV